MANTFVLLGLKRCNSSAPQVMDLILVPVCLLGKIHESSCRTTSLAIFRTFALLINYETSAQNIVVRKRVG
jgi:hypothetical protein